MRRFVGSTLLCILAHANAHASPIEINATVDLNQAISLGYVTYGVFDLLQSVSLQPGDSVDMTVHFMPGQRLRIASWGGQQFLTGWLYPDFSQSTPGASNFTIESVSLSFLGLTGYGIGELTSSTQTDGSGHIGPLFFSSYIPDGEGVTFSGYRAQYEVAALQEAPYYYSGIFLQFAALNGGSVSVITEVSEPATWQLLSFPLVVAFLSRKRLRPNPSLKRTRTGRRRMALISFWAMRRLPVRAALQEPMH